MEFIGILLGGIFFSFCLACWIVLSVVRKFSRTLMIAGIVIILIPAAIGAISFLWYAFVTEPDILRFHDAASAGDFAKVRTILDSGMYIDADFEGSTALSSASFSGQTEMVRFLLKHGAGKQPWVLDESLSDATRADHMDIVSILLTKGASPKSDRAQDALTEAVRNGNAEMVRSLLAHGADPNAKDPYTNRSLLATAGKTGNKAIVKLLRDAGARE